MVKHLFGSSRVEGQQIDLVVMSMDESVSVELSNVRTVKYMPTSESCIAKKEDLENWPHLSDTELQQLDIGGVMLVIGLKEKANLFLPLECRAGEEGEPVAVRYSLGWISRACVIKCWWNPKTLMCSDFCGGPTEII